MSPYTDCPDWEGMIDLGLRLWAWNSRKGKENGTMPPTIDAVVVRERWDLVEGGIIIALDKKGKWCTGKVGFYRNITSYRYSWLSVC